MFDALTQRFVKRVKKYIKYGKILKSRGAFVCTRIECTIHYASGELQLAIVIPPIHTVHYALRNTEKKKVLIGYSSNMHPFFLCEYMKSEACLNLMFVLRSL